MVTVVQEVLKSDETVTKTATSRSAQHPFPTYLFLFFFFAPSTAIIYLPKFQREI